MNPNQMIYFNALVLQHDFNDEARRSRESERNHTRPAEAETAERTASKGAERTASKGDGHSLLGFLHLALPGRR